MSLESATATTDAAGPASLAAPGERTRIEYFRAYQQAVQSPNWFVNLLWGMLAFFSSGVIPLVGPMVWTGYLYECVEVLAATRGRVLPDFDVNRFGEYITRGVWPFFAQLAIWFALALAYFLLYVFMVLIALATSAVGEEHIAIVLSLGGMLYAFSVAAVIVTPMIVLAPLMLRLGLSQDLTIGLNFRWWGDFLRRMWLETVVTTLFVLLTGMILTTLGCALLFIGTYVTWAWVTLANAHLSWQLYDLYLTRGGQSVPLKPRQPVPPPYRYPEMRGADRPPPANSAYTQRSDR
jgi:hypothetical protein